MVFLVCNKISSSFVAFPGLHRIVSFLLMLFRIVSLLICQTSMSEGYVSFIMSSANCVILLPLLLLIPKQGHFQTLSFVRPDGVGMEASKNSSKEHIWMYFHSYRDYLKNECIITRNVVFWRLKLEKNLHIFWTPEFL